MGGGTREGIAEIVQRKKAGLISRPDMESKYPIITAGEFKLDSLTMSQPRESNRSGNRFLVSGMLATLGASACCQGGLKFLCGSQPEIRDGSDQEEARRAGLGMQERAHSTPF